MQCVCVRVGVLLCLVFIIAVQLVNKLTFYPLSPLTSQVTVFVQCHTGQFKSLRVGDSQLEIYLNLRITAEGGMRTVTSNVAGECVSHAATVNQQCHEHCTVQITTEFKTYSVLLHCAAVLVVARQGWMRRIMPPLLEKISRVMFING